MDFAFMAYNSKQAYGMSANDRFLYNFTMKQADYTTNRCRLSGLNLVCQNAHGHIYSKNWASQEQRHLGSNFI